MLSFYPGRCALIALALLAACGGPSREQWEATAALAEALQHRQIEQVSRAARQAGPWRGQDPALDRLIGDALANVLMRPEDGMPLLLANPAPDDADWRSALRGAALRSGDRVKMKAAWQQTGGADLDFEQAVVDQLAARAKADPGFDLRAVDSVLARCKLLERRPTVGRRSVDHPVEGDLFAAARALGAQVIVLARSTELLDEGTGSKVWRCYDLTLMDDDGLPAQLPPKITVLGASDGAHDVFLDLREEDGVPMIFSANNPDWAGRWIRAAALITAAGDPAAGARQVQETLGAGLAGSAFPGQNP